MQEPDKEPEMFVVKEDSSRDIWRGMGLALLLHLIQIPLAAVTFFFSLIFFGVSQLLYIVPAIFYYRKQGRPDVVKGLIIAAGITFLLNATCTALIFSNLDFR